MEPLRPLPLVPFEEVDLPEMDKLEVSLDDLMNLELANGIGAFPLHGTHAAKLQYTADAHHLKDTVGGAYVTGSPVRIKPMKKRSSSESEQKRGRVSSPQVKDSKRKRSRKQHNWTHQDIMELILIWGEVQLEPSDGVHKWQCIYNKYREKHEWASLSCIQSYFKAKVKCAYNCKLVYDFIVSKKTFPTEEDKWIYLLPRNKTPKKFSKHMLMR